METIQFHPTPGATVRGYIHMPLTEMEVHRTTYPAVVICPGGGYAFLSEREADPVAFHYFAAGYNVFILYYTIGENAKNFTPLTELSKTVMHIRDNAKSLLTDPGKIAVCGFSAGGHLAASLGTLWNHPALLAHLDAENGKNRPDAMILSYPVITADTHAHEGSIRLVSGCEPGTEGYEFFSLDTKVSGDTCPAFIWHTVTDDAVPVENSLQLILALQKHEIPFEAHLFADGPHGISVCSEETGSYDAYNARWMDMSIKWLNKLFSYRP